MIRPKSKLVVDGNSKDPKSISGVVWNSTAELLEPNSKSTVFVTMAISNRAFTVRISIPWTVDCTSPVPLPPLIMYPFRNKFPPRCGSVSLSTLAVDSKLTVVACYCNCAVIAG
jgi:hypothetical protein